MILTAMAKIVKMVLLIMMEIPMEIIVEIRLFTLMGTAEALIGNDDVVEDLPSLFSVGECCF